MNTQELLQTIASSWQLIVLALAVIAAFIFRKELGALIGQLKEFEFDPRNRKFEVKTPVIRQRRSAKRRETVVRNSNDTSLRKSPNGRPTKKKKEVVHRVGPELRPMMFSYLSRTSTRGVFQLVMRNLPMRFTTF